MQIRAFLSVELEQHADMKLCIAISKEIGIYGSVILKIGGRVLV